MATYLSYVLPLELQTAGITRGDHYHNAKTEKFFVEERRRPHPHESH